jgi:hypothetical protein
MQPTGQASSIEATEGIVGEIVPVPRELGLPGRRHYFVRTYDPPFVVTITKFMITSIRS